MNFGPRKMSQKSRVHAALPSTLVLFSAPNGGSPLVTQFRVDLISSSGLDRHCMLIVQVYADKRFRDMK